MGEWVRNTALGGALIVGLGVIGAVSGLSFGADLQEYDEKKTFAAQNLSKIMIETGDVDVNLLPGVTNEAVVHLHGAGRAETYHLTADQKGNELRIAVDHDPVYFSLNPSAVRTSIRLDVTVPQKQYEELKAELSSGDLTAEDLKAKRMEFTTSSGDATLERAEGESLTVTASSGDLLLRQITAKTGEIVSTSGDIRVDTWQGGETVSSSATSGDMELGGIDSRHVRLRASSGDIRLTGAGQRAELLDAEMTSGEMVLNDVSGAVRARAAAGDITVRLKEMTGDVNVYSSSGDTVVALPGSASFEFALTNSSGDVEMDFPATYQSNDEHRKSGIIGSGGKKLSIETSSGQIGVRKN